VDAAGLNTTTIGPQFAGSGVTFRPLTTGCPPSTRDACTGSCEGSGGDPNVTVIRPPATLCFWASNDETPEDPATVIEQVIESVGGQSYVHIRVTFDPSFTDSTYGTGACCGWPEKRGHTMRDLAVSDHTELLLTNGKGEDVINFKIDLVSESATATCGYATLGVTGGDGAVLEGDASYVLGTSTSMHRNLNGCGYCDEAACDGDCRVNSPKTDLKYTPNPETPNWDYRQVYEVWIALEAFGGDFGQAYVTYTHSSPAKSSADTLQVTGGPCPDTWSKPYCPPGASDCFGSGQPEGCLPNYQSYVTQEGAVCTPIPFAGWPDRAACPSGYVLDVASEGRYCLKS
jgi:hypothetical protein